MASDLEGGALNIARRRAPGYCRPAARFGSDSDRNLDDGAVILPIFALSQGIVAALGSRLLSGR